MKALGEAEAVIVAGLDSRFSFSVVGRAGAARRAPREPGSWRSTPASRTWRAWPTTGCGRDPARRRGRSPGWSVRCWAAPSRRRRGCRASCRALAAAARRLEGARTLAVVVGPRVFDCAGAEELVAELEALAGREGIDRPAARPRRQHARRAGAGSAGGRAARPAAGRRPMAGLTLAQLRAGRRPKVLYLVGEAPFTARPDCDFVIAQDLYLPPFEVDAFLPAASFAEAEGTLTNIEGRVQELRPVEHLPAGAVHGVRPARLEDLLRPRRRLGHPDLEYADAAAVRAAIRAELPRLPGRARPVAAAHDADGGVAGADDARPTRRRPTARAASSSCRSTRPSATAASTSPAWSRGSASCTWRRGCA